ncbi:MAG: HAMP domain-containing histidine kinase [Defluviitaleaceae bacterium]|nr:HAMP domain-containing histidine kinase [Defluviitaleaceae bacterium]
MKLKTFLAAYMLFLSILFVSIGIVSAHMTSSTTYMLQEKASREFQTISTSLARDIAAVFSRFPGGYEYQMAANNIFSGYIHYYRQHNIVLTLTSMPVVNREHGVITFRQEDSRHFISIIGALPVDFGEYQLSYTLDITGNITDMQEIQRYLWVTSIVVSVIAAGFLYAILHRIFKPLVIVAKAAGEIADGQYGNRITVKGNNELAAVAIAFNRMSQQIESQISLLEDEAERKQHFVDSFAHEIRTPLTSIYGYAEYLHKASLTEGELVESAGYIMSEADHMKKVANSLLELATLRNYEPEISPIFIPELFIEIKQGLEKPLNERKAELRTQALAPYIEGQRDLIKSLLLNLCNNAIKACEPGEGVVRLSATVEGQSIIIAVDDNGCGIHSDQIPKLTEPFFRVDKARTREQGGVGLGLALCKQIADVHNAKMTIDSIPGIGTMVRVKFTKP